MPRNKNTIQQSLLGNLLNEQKDRVAALLRSLSGQGPTDGMKPSAFHRFKMTLEQIYIAKEEEKRLISQIDLIEEQHRINRKRHLLRRVDDTPKAKPEAEFTPEPEPQPKRSGSSLWWIIALYYLLTSPKPKPK